MRQDRVVAGRYAAALLRTAVAQGELDRVEQDLQFLVQTLAAEETLTRFLASPRETPATKKQLVDRVFGERLAPTTRRFFHLLIDKKRQGLLPVIYERYREHANDVRGVAVAKVRVAQPLSAAAEALLRERVKALTGREVQLEVTVDPTVVGGVWLRVGNRVIDYTLEKQLEQLRAEIISGRGPEGSGASRQRVRWKHKE